MNFGGEVMDRIKRYMVLHQKDILRDIQFLVERDSPSTDKELVDACEQRIQKLFLRYFGYKAEEIKEEKYGNHLRFTMGKGKETILILSHFDTVWDKGDLPFKIEGNKVYGPGVLDMKGGLVQAIWALKAIKDLKIKLTKKLFFFVLVMRRLAVLLQEKLLKKKLKAVIMRL